MKFFIRWLLAAFVSSAATGAYAQASGSHCEEFGGQRFCAQHVQPLLVFKACWSQRAAEIERNPASATADWLWPASDATTCMSSRGVSASPAAAPSGKVGCTYFGDAGKGQMVKWCKAGARGDEAFQAYWGYCMSVGLVFYDHGILPWHGNGDPNGVVGYLPCMRAQNWSAEVVDMSKEHPSSPEQRVGAKGSI